MNDITERKDVEFLVDSFYKKAIKNETIGFFFTKVVTLDWDHHMPVMYDFWEGILLGKTNYKGNPMTKHFGINSKVAMEEKHFQAWLALWKETVLENFQGEMANEAISRATQIAGLMQYKMAEHTQKLKGKV